MFKVIYFYILKCSDNTYYCGVTNDLELRIKQHNTGMNIGSYTYCRRPVSLMYSTMFTDFNEAFRFEARIKKWSRAKKEALIKGEYNVLPELSKKQFRS